VAEVEGLMIFLTTERYGVFFHSVTWKFYEQVRKNADLYNGYDATSKKLDKNIMTVSKWCTNQVQPTMENLFKIAEALEVDVRELLISTK
jgi:hypothetical protein